MTEAGAMQTLIIDLHLHLIYRDRLSYPWLADVAALNRDFHYETYAVEARRCGVTDALHMEVDVAPGTSTPRRAMSRRSLSRTAARREAQSAHAVRRRYGFSTFLELRLADLFVRGFRRVLHVVPDDISERPLFRENLRRLTGAGRPFDLCVRPDQIDKAMALADAAPELQFVLDHCGVPAIEDRAEHPWRENIAEIAKRPNVAVKVSGVVAYADPAVWTIDDIRPYVEHAIANFGWDRVVWGSDWPVCTLSASLSTWVAATHAITLGCSKDERQRLLSANARRIWRLPN